MRSAVWNWRSGATVKRQLTWSRDRRALNRLLLVTCQDVFRPTRAGRDNLDSQWEHGKNSTRIALWMTDPFILASDRHLDLPELNKMGQWLSALFASPVSMQNQRYQWRVILPCLRFWQFASKSSGIWVWFQLAKNVCRPSFLAFNSFGPFGQPLHGARSCMNFCFCKENCAHNCSVWTALLTSVSRPVPVPCYSHQ